MNIHIFYNAGLLFKEKTVLSIRKSLKNQSYLYSFTVCMSFFVIGVVSLLLFSNTVAREALFVFFLFSALCCVRTLSALPVLMLIAGFSWANFCFDRQLQQMLPSEYEGVTIQVTGKLLGIPDQNHSRTRFDFYIAAATTSSNSPISELKNKKITLSCYRCIFDFKPNQEWQLSVRLKRPHSYASWGAFDYEKYLFRHQIIATGYIRDKEINSLKGISNQLSINSWRWEIRNFLANHLANYPIGEAVLAALMIGDKSKITNQQNLVFQKTGINHLMAISGLHIGLAFLAAIAILKICCMPFAQLYNRVPRQRLVLLPALVIAFSYAALAGFAISTQRAIIMLSVFVLIRLLMRETSLFKVLLIAVFIMLVYDPWSILDVGFWLSCSAVFIIAVLGWIRLRGDDEENINSLSLMKLQPALWLGMLPLTLVFFGKLSLISPIVNLVMVPLFCLILIPLTLFSLLLKLLGLIDLSRSLMELLAFIYEWVFQCLAWLAELPFAQWPLPPMMVVDWLLFISVLLSFYFVWRFRYYLLILFLGVLFTPNLNSRLAFDETPLAEYPLSQYKVALLDVGQGLAMVVTTQDYTLVYDTGPAYSSGFNTAEAVLIPYLHYFGIKKIDTLIISHADNDHIGGLSALLSEFDVGETLTSRTDKVSNSSSCQRGQKWSTGSIYFEILGPDANTPEGSNNLSCVLTVTNKYIKTLITGDIEKSVEKYLLDTQTDLVADILLVPHQGSKTSSTAAFINAVKPSIGLIAAGYRNHYGHPHKDVVARYKENNVDLYSTIENGSIILNIIDKNIDIQSYRVTKKGFWHTIKKST